MSRAFWDQVAGAAWSHVSGTNGAMILIFWGILALAAVFSYFQLPRPRSIRRLFGHLLPRSTIRHPSARADLLFWLCRRLFIPLLVVPLALSTVTAGHLAYWLLGQLFEHPAHQPGQAGPLMLCAFTLTVLGINVYFVRNTVLMMDFILHTNLKVSYGRWLNHIFLCPHYHQLHHSIAKQHWDRNFGLAFAIWDRMFGTLIVPKPGEDFLFGLPDREAEEYQSLARLHFVPLNRIALLVRRRWTTAMHARLHDSRQLFQTTDR